MFSLPFRYQNGLAIRQCGCIVVVIGARWELRIGEVNMKYGVNITEAFAHYLEVEADTEEEAYAKALELVSNVDAETLTKTNAYTLDPIGFDGYWSADEVTR
jgi:hypothetical protein